MKRQKDEPRIEARFLFDGGIYSLFDCFRETDAIRAGERVSPDHAIGDDLGRGTACRSAWVLSLRLIHEHAQRGQFHRFGHETGVEVDGTEVCIEGAQGRRTAEQSEKAE